MTRTPLLTRVGKGLHRRIVPLANVPRLLRSLWRTAPGLASAIAVSRLLRALQAPAMLFVAKLIIDEVLLQGQSPAPGPSLADWIESGRASGLAGWILIEFLLVAAGGALTRFNTVAETLLAERHGHGQGIELVRQATRLDLKDIESSAAQDKLQRANAATMLGGNLLSILLTQIQNAITLIALLAGLVAFVPGLILLVVLALAPVFIVEARFNALQYEASVALTPERRRMNYLQQLGIAALSAKEVKLFGLGDYLTARMAEVAERIMRSSRSIAVRRALWGSVVGTIGSLAYYGAYAVIIWRALTGELSIGDLTFLAGSLMRLNGLLEGLVVGVAQIGSQIQYLNDFYAFIDMRSAVVAPEHPKAFPAPLRQGVVFENVGFRYPGKEDWALRHLSFSLPAGRTLALVGENGAGKTTIVKLLTRLYEPDEGRILVDGVDLREIELGELREHVGTIFQDFVRYNLTAAENIGVGRISALTDRTRVVAAAQKSQADVVITGLPGGYDQMLGLSFMQGLDLSGGQWQRLAIARAYFRDAQVLILDEPTAALDARAEAEIFERFRHLSENTTTLLISHRFATVRMADRILVLENGAILESGSHGELMALRGRYAELFEMQAAGFQ
ncbi:MAG TPA: ABC transporter ATP-binding protein [Bosea sp. (in: a-proteobacteria)]|jgi:ATP-binding cassette subfamily B protein|uniref:ABC transporter ATP-binding protein n=1 Tax=Bosea sp. (in: a-proteobacteria) TaxID=1871050 RepID=UPI002E113DED|nr:ABC transporter ATP-binding protein [Bosea sp. (in: a-proteobacteria)]